LVLTYSLVHSTLGPNELSAGSNKSIAKVNSLFSYWKKNIDHETSALAFMLNDRVDDEILSYSALKGEDLRVVTLLRDAGEIYDFSVYLGGMKRWIPLNEEYEDYEFHYERELDQSDAKSMLSRVVELDGTEVAKDMDFEDVLIQEDAFDDVEPDDEDSDTGFYYRTV
jgi:hypothetical protein